LATNFTPFISLFGGALIGLAAVLIMLTLGRVMGATGILTGAIVPGSFQERAWRIAALIGMLSAPGLLYLMTGTWPEISIVVSTPMIIISGLIVGAGVTLGSGCTSGHGVCGLARLSRRSIVAVVLFMLSALSTVFIMRHILGEAS